MRRKGPCCDKENIFSAFRALRQEIVACSDQQKAVTAASFGQVLERLSAVLERREGALLEPRAVEKDKQDFMDMSEELGLARTKGVKEFLDAALSIARAGAVSPKAYPSSSSKVSEFAFVEQPVAKRTLLRVVPSSRYGGAKKFQALGSSLELQPVAKFEARLKAEMAANSTSCGSSSLPVHIQRLVLVSDSNGAEATLAGPASSIDGLFAASERYATYFTTPMASRCADVSVPYPIFICSKGRAECSLLNWQATHCLGKAAELQVPVVIVVEPQEEESYRAAWPTFLFLVLWMITSSSNTATPFRDLLLSSMI